MKKILSKCKSPIEIIKIIKKYEPKYLLAAIPQIFLGAILPLLYVYYPKLIIDELTSNVTYFVIGRTISTFGVLLLSVTLCNGYLKDKSQYHAELFIKKLKYEIGNVAMQMELSDIENPSTQDIIQMASKATELVNITISVQKIISYVITIIGLVYLIIKLDSIFIFLVFLTLGIKLFFLSIQHGKNKELRAFEAKNWRFVEYLFFLSFLSEGGAKEIRLNNLQNWYMEKNKIYRNRMVTHQFRAFRLYAFFQIIFAILLAIQSFIILWLLGTKYLAGTIQIADFTMYFTAVTTLSVSLTGLAEEIERYSLNVLDAVNYKKMLSYIQTTKEETVTLSSKSFERTKSEVIFHHVSFTYPNTTIPVLTDINITISDKEKLVIVGRNGAGKSTFIKLLCKFYKPTDGKITLNGVDIWDISNEEYYKMMTAVFQDFSNFVFSLRDNIAMTAVSDEERMKTILSQIGLKEKVDHLQMGLDTHITKTFHENGIEFSGGEAQKVAIARAIYKGATLLILDEPTASLDPKAESEIYQDFFRLAENKTTIFISHRLAVSTIADHIAVFSDGKIVEYGTHHDLMLEKGIYAQMYQKQSRQYRIDKKIF